MIALISVSDKTGVVEFAASLSKLGYEIISTGGTASVLIEAGISVRKVADVTGFAEIMEGRVKTLHPTIHGGILADMDKPDHVAAMKSNGIRKIDIVAVNLYPFEKTVATPDATYTEIVENIDIGGPAMVRAAAKNHKHTTVVVNRERYSQILEQLQENGTVTEGLRKQLALEAFSHTAHYDACISQYFANQQSVGLLSEGAIPLRVEQQLRYGENPHQSAALYGQFGNIFRQLHGKELSYNNILDIDAASKLCLEFAEPTVVIVKHNNPCGVGSSSELRDAYRKAFATDTVSPFGGIIAVNRMIDDEFANEVHGLFAEVIIAPSFSDGALEILQKKKDRRLVTCNQDLLRSANALEFRAVAGGFLAQDSDSILYNPADLQVVSDRAPSEDEMASMEYAWKIAKHVKSNAIVYALADRSLAVGAGQMSRVDSVRIAVRKAADSGISLAGCAVASDAFFPFADGLLHAADAGATCVIQPGGSVRDNEVIAAANEMGLAMVFTGTRHFRH